MARNRHPKITALRQAEKDELAARTRTARAYIAALDAAGSQTALADALGVTRQAVSLRLQSARRTLGL
jgi:biotin operon repressor